MKILQSSRMSTILLLGVALVLSVGVVCAHDDQRYDKQEAMPLFVDNVIPEDNPSESYRYYALAFCKPEDEKHKVQTLGEVLGGSRKIYSNYDIRYDVDVQRETLCTKKLTATEITEFRYAVAHQYHYTMYLDEIQLRGYVGTQDTKSGDLYLYTTLHFKISKNRDRVIEAHVTPEESTKVLLKDGDTSLDVSFAYTVKWTDTEVTFEDRTANNEAEHDEGEVEIQWFSIVNSFVLVVLLTAFLVYIVLRILNKDYQRYSILEEEADVEETGWKRLHADVFRFPPMKALFASIVGCGTQVMLIFVCMLTLAVVGVFYPHGRGTMYATVIVVYALTAVIAGYVSGSLYKKMEGKDWVHNVLLTVTLVTGPAFMIWAYLNTVAIAYGSTAALPFGTIVGLFALYFLVTFPLTLAGALAGKHYTSDFDAPTRTKFAAREIPTAPWYRGSLAHVLVAGFLPFTAIYIELYYVFISIWGHRNFAPFGILYLVFIILIVVTACITIALTYVQLSHENHRWWWLSVISGGATSFFVYLYSMYFLVNESHMTGLLQLSFYFGYMGLLCYGLFLMLGAVGFFASMIFVRQIYRSIKCD
ncbi:endomembrane protein 70, putative [Bodo saltans]|uniref:Transmembrane 9 superfamily member n=1 Tax=Bodo saltans TaxID=75058 RepID=A0A0S4JZ31_BODSA|nr:endomembrane protein 70, putative [Bodo saltans]|eukprot:CUG93857.1 endomembrane protein 70, putative [Bodo saltans]